MIWSILLLTFFSTGSTNNVKHELSVNIHPLYHKHFHAEFPEPLPVEISGSLRYPSLVSGIVTLVSNNTTGDNKKNKNLKRVHVSLKERLLTPENITNMVQSITTFTSIKT